MSKFNKSSSSGSRRGGTSGKRTGAKKYGASPRRSSDKKESSERTERYAKPDSSSRPFRPSTGKFSRPRKAKDSPFPPRERSDDKRSEGGDTERKPFRRSASSERSPERKFSSDRERKPYRRPAEGDAKEERRPFSKERKPFGRASSEGEPRGDRPPSSRERKPYTRSDSEGGERKSYVRKTSDADAKDERPFTRERKTYGRTASEGDAKEERRPFTRDKKPYARPAAGGDNKAPRRPYSTERKPFRKSDDDKPRRSSSFGSDSKAPRRSSAGDSSEPRKWNRKESHEFYGDRRKGPGFAKGPKKPKTTAADDGLTRLNKFISNAGICSRREADEMIKAGVITVNGEVVTEMGFKVQVGDVVRYNNEVLRGERLVYILLNKPKDFITTTDDPEERKTVMSLIASAGKERVYPVGRLDRNTTGILLFTNDGDLARKLTHPSFEVQKVYQVELDSSLKSTDMAAIVEGIRLDDGFIKVDDIAYTTDDKSILGVELHSGKNRIVRRIFEHLGYKVKKLDRVIFAGLTKKDLPRGRWRFLTEMEVANLKMMTGSKKKIFDEE